MRAATDVGAEVDLPEEGPVQPVGLQAGRAGADAVVGRVEAAQLLLEDEFELAVAVEIADRGVVGLVTRRRAQCQAVVAGVDRRGRQAPALA
ncbi:MAG TPA: hypothetical protein DCZ72_10470, partial [Armatimonadetes bacterium]|nr:hypothetical protein [Armatimonadota bacterium]